MRAYFTMSQFHNVFVTRQRRRWRRGRELTRMILDADSVVKRNVCFGMSSLSLHVWCYRPSFGIIVRFQYGFLPFPSFPLIWHSMMMMWELSSSWRRCRGHCRVLDCLTETTRGILVCVAVRIFLRLLILAISLWRILAISVVLKSQVKKECNNQHHQQEWRIPFLILKLTLVLLPLRPR